MSNNEVSWTSGLSLKHIIDDLKKMGGPPGFEVVAGLETALAAAFADTQALTHVITSSLKFSGKVSSDFDGDDWVGQITYGGSSTGSNNPVDYAIFEMARGGEHDFFRTLPQFDEQFEQAIDKHFD